MTTIYIACRREESPAEAWDDEECEGWYACAWHADDRNLSDEYRYELVPADLLEDVLRQGRCSACLEGWADSERRRHDGEAVARMEEYLRRR